MAYLLRGAHVVDPQLGLDDVRDVLVDGEKIACVGEGLQPPADAEVVDASGKYLVPGLVDMHVHFRDPGFEYKETSSPVPVPRSTAASPTWPRCPTPTP